MNRNYIVTNRASPIAGITAQIDRETYNKFQSECDKLNTTKGALLRQLVEEFLRQGNVKWRERVTNATRHEAIE